jgi:hypothetical protein
LIRKNKEQDIKEYEEEKLANEKTIHEILERIND